MSRNESDLQSGPSGPASSEGTVDSARVEDVAGYKAEIAALRARIDELEKALAERSDGRGHEGAPRGALAAGAQAPLVSLPTMVPALVHWRLDGTVTHWSEGTERIFGWSANEAVGRRLADLVAADPVTPEAVQAFDSAPGESRFAIVESACNTKQGRTFLCRWAYAVLRDARGDLREIGAVVEDTSDRQRSEQALHERYQLLAQLVDNSPSAIFIKDLNERYVFINRFFSQERQKHILEYIGRKELEINSSPREFVEEVVAREREVMASGQLMQFEEFVPANGVDRHFFTIKFPMRNEREEPIGLGGIVTDITPLKRAEAERVALQEQIIAAQQATLRELSTPLVPLADGVVAMPLVGAIDSRRAEQLMESLLAGISSQCAHTAILDITGVHDIDTRVADALMRTASAARLLGTRVVLTGVRPEVAQALVEIGADLSGIITLSTLQRGIAYALRTASR